MQTQIFFLHFVRDKKTASEDSHPFNRAISGINTHKKKKKKIESISTAILWSYKEAVDIFVVGNFLIS